MQRYWINNPSTAQPFYDVHAKRVLADIGKKEYDGKRVRAYFAEGNIVSMLIDPAFLSAGWPDLAHRNNP
jgi:hypothetical protein